MPIEMGIWRIDSTGGPQKSSAETLTKLPSSQFEHELRLENLLVNQLEVLGLDLMTIGRQVMTPSGKRVDILAVDPTGELYVIELKRDRTPREVIAQLLDYGSWASTLSHEALLGVYQAHSSETPFEQAFADHFGGGAPPDSINQVHHLLLVASELDAASERIINYCISFGLPINAVFFRYFRDASNEYLARSWLVDPEVAESNIKEVGKEPWTGDYYASFGDDDHHNWDDARKFGFISGGGGKWYTRTLKMLQAGDRVFVHIPGRGFVGVGEVLGERVKAVDFQAQVNGESVLLPTAVKLKSPKIGENAQNDDLAEFAIPVKWLAGVPREQAYWENGFFANQNTVCKLRSRFTRDRVLEHFGLAT